MRMRSSNDKVVLLFGAFLPVSYKIPASAVFLCHTFVEFDSTSFLRPTEHFYEGIGVELI